MVKSALLSNYRIKEFIQFISNALMIAKQHGPDKLKIKAQYSVLLQDHEKLQEAYKQDNMSEITPQLVALDDRRDQAMICLRQVCDGFMHHFNDKKKASAKKVVDCIDKYGAKLYALNYSAETAALKNLVRDLLGNADYLAAIQELHVEDVVNEMDQANTKFEKLFVKRLGESGQNEKGTTELIRLASASYRKMVSHINAHSTLDPSDDYASLVDHINENVDHFNQIVERRKGTVVKGQEEIEMIVEEPITGMTV